MSHNRHIPIRKHPFLRGSPLGIAVPSVVSVLLFSIAIFVVVLPAVRKSIMDQKKQLIRQLVQATWSTIAVNHDEQRRGLLSKEEAQARALQRIRSLRYGRNLKDYFWVTRLDGTLVLHPYRPDLEGQDVLDYRDPDGVRLFEKIVNVARNQGEGYVEYVWQWKDDPTRTGPKLSYVKLFEPWGWIIGTGVYVDDVRTEMQHLTRTLTAVALTIMAFALLLSYIIISQATRTEHQRQLAESELRYERDFTRNLIDTARSIVLVLDTEGRVVTINRFGRELTGYTLEGLQGMDWFETCVPAREREVVRNAFHHAFTTPGSSGYVNSVMTRDGQERIIEWYENQLKDPNGELVGMLAIGMDVTEREEAEATRDRLEQQLRQAQKMEAIGQLAGGIAHDFNNLLTVIQANAELVTAMVNDNDDATDALQSIREAANHASGVTRSLLTFSRRVPVEKGRMDLCQVTRSSIRILRRMLSAMIELIEDVDSDPIWVDADETQIHQVVINLAINARDAMPDGGQLRISVSRTEDVDVDQIPDDANASAGYAQIAVSDTGEGIDPSFVPRIFEPFFSTKARGEGTGLGLSISHGIVEDHGGYIDVTSTPGQGTTFRVILPCAGEDGQTQEPGKPILEDRQGQGELILLAEDQQFVANVMSTSLKMAGYEVFHVGDGQSLLDEFEKRHQEISLLLLDVDLPAMDGLSCLETIRGQGSDLPIIIMTGSVRTDIADRLDDRTRLVRKPFRMNIFLATVHEMVRQSDNRNE